MVLLQWSTRRGGGGGDGVCGGGGGGGGAPTEDVFTGVCKWGGVVHIDQSFFVRYQR